MRIILHIGMHKTASTTIQKRLTANNKLLQDFGYVYIAKEREALLKAVEKKNFKPWLKLIRNTANHGSTPIVSHEAFSHVLCRKLSSKKTTCLGDWLLKKLNKAGVSVVMIGFIRDQPSYLNSHYTQHVKRFVTALFLEDYAAKAMRPTLQKTTCDPVQLFGWLEHHTSVQTNFFPYGRSITPQPQQQHAANDPFAQLVQCLGIPDSVAFAKVDNLNAQPGDLAIRAALQLSQELKQEGLRLGKKANLARTLLCREAKQRHWDQTPYIGLNQELNQRIQDHFSSSNNRFAERVWGCPWDQIFTTRPLREAKIPTRKEQDEIDQVTKQIRRKLFRDQGRFTNVIRPIREGFLNCRNALRIFR